MEGLQLSDVVDINITIWTYLGVWPPKFSSKLIYILYFLYSFIILIFLILLYIFCMAINAIVLFQLSSDLTQLTESGFVLLTDIVMLIKLFNITRHRNSIKQLLKTLEIDDFFNTDPNAVEIIKDCMQIINKTTIVYFAMSIGTLVAMSLTPLLNLSARILPFFQWNWSGSPIIPSFEFLYIYQTIGMTIHLSLNISMDMFPFSMMALAGGHLDVLIHSLETVGNFADCDGDWDDENKKKIIKCVEHHKFIIEFVQDVERIFSLPITVQFILSAVIICITGFLMSTLSVMNDFAKFFMMMMYIMTMLIQIFLPCWFGNEIIFKSSNLSKAAYSSSWPNGSLSHQKIISLFMERTKRPTQITAGKFLTLSLQTFTSILNTAYSYYAVLQHMQSSKTLLDTNSC